MTSLPLLSMIIFLPVLGGLLVLASWRAPSRCRWIALGTAIIDLALVIGLMSGGQGSHVSRWMRVEDTAWIERFGIRYSLGLDGISLVLVVLTAFLGVLTVMVSWNQVRERVSAFYSFLLFMQTGVLGVFLATDLFLFYLFWEIQLVPMFFLIGIWGHEGRIPATIKFVLFSITGSLLMLIALISLYLLHGSATGSYTFSLLHLLNTPLTPTVSRWLFGAFLLAFAIKIPLFPVHTWLPDAHTEAPTAGSVILAGLLLKTGAYGLLRFAVPLFPSAARESAPLLLGLGLVGLFYASWIALAQKDMKRLVAYSSIAHMGLVVIGIAALNSITLSGAVLQMVNHGITTSALFIMVGMLDERMHTRELASYGGVWKKAPVLSAFFLLFGMASVGLPGLNNFTGEIIILLGVFRQHPIVGGLGFLAIVFTLVYVLRLLQDSLFGMPKDEAPLADVSAREMAILAPLGLAILVIGLYPAPILDVLQGPVQTLLENVAKP